MYYRCQETHKKKEMSRKEEKTEKWMSCREGSKFTEIKDWLAEREREGAMNFLPSVSVLLGWCYVRAECTHTDYLRLVQLITWGTTSLCVCVCVCGGGVREYVCVNIQWWYLSVTFHAQRHERTLYRQHTYNLLFWALIQKGSDHLSKV